MQLHQVYILSHDNAAPSGLYSVSRQCSFIRFIFCLTIMQLYQVYILSHDNAAPSGLYSDNHMFGLSFVKCNVYPSDNHMFGLSFVKCIVYQSDNQMFGL